MLRAGVSRVPLIGGMVDPKYEQSVTEINNSVAQMVKSLQETTRMANAERVDIEERLSALPRFIDRPDAFQNRLIALDNVLSGIEQGAVSRTQEANIGASRRQEAEQKASEVRRIRQVCPRASTRQNKPKPLSQGPSFCMFRPISLWFVNRGNHGRGPFAH
jgi:cell division septum initiation protein DivIVA